MIVSLIVAVSDNGVIGRSGQLPWHLSRDLRRFKRRTLGHHILMGRRTYESIGRPLPGRQGIVITRDPQFQAEGYLVVQSLPEALQCTGDDDEVFVVGGRQIYELALSQAQRLYWTQVHAQVDGDILFPDIDWLQWQLLEEEAFAADDRNEHPCTFRVFQRVSSETVHDG
jgi:dihydrofolate reductase